MVKRFHYVLAMTLILFLGVSSVTSDFVFAAHKNDYVERYHALEQKCQRKFKYDGSQLEMNEDSYAEYKLWNKELKHVYKTALKDMDESEAQKLEASELKWRKKRKKNATKDAAVYEGGSMQPFAFHSSMTAQTKERIQWLIKNYF